jgi:uncharacterized protein with HEPN domain
MSRDYGLYLADMEHACRKIIRYTSGLSFAEFIEDEKTFDAVVRNLEVIGEAAKHIPSDVRDRYPRVAWSRIAGLRDIVAHEYFGLDVDILWDIIQNHVPALLEEVQRILSQEVE